MFPLRHHHEINLVFLFSYKDRIFQSKASYLFKMLFFEKCVRFCTFASLALSCIPKPFMLWTKVLVTQNNIKEKSFQNVLMGSRPRPISTGQLHTLLHFHLQPIYLVVFQRPYFFRMRYLILRGASCLDAFSTYPFQT